MMQVNKNYIVKVPDKIGGTTILVNVHITNSQKSRVRRPYVGLSLTRARRSPLRTTTSPDCSAR